MPSVALLQLRVDGTEPVDSRITRTLVLAASACEQSDFVMLPELWPTGAFDVTMSLAHAEPLDGGLVTALSELAGRTRTWIHGGSFMEVDSDGHFFNTSVLFNDSGALVATYRKIHLFGFDTGEAKVVNAGDEIVVVDTIFGPTALATCYDLRFPELFRDLTDAGAETVLLTSGWPKQRIRHWEVLAEARAIENQTWLLGCNEVGTHVEMVLGGHSLVIDPLGAVIARGGDSEEVVTADVDPGLPGQVRKSFPVLADRRLRQ